MVREFSPLNVSAFFRGVEVVAELLELLGRKYDLGHVKTNSELCLSNKSTSKLVEVSEEFSNSNSLLEASRSNSSNNIFDVLWLVL